MSWAEHNCQEVIESLCKNCIENQLLCKKYCCTHSIIQASYITNEFDIHESDLIKKVFLEMKSDNKISKIIESYRRFKSEFYEILQNQIVKKSLIEDYALDALLLKLTEACLIKKGFYITEDKFLQIKIRVAELSLSIEKLNSDLDDKKKELDALNSSINLKLNQFREKGNELNSVIQELNSKFENKAKEVENLSISITEKEKEIQYLNSVNQEKDMQNKEKNQLLENYNSELVEIECSVQNIQKFETILNKHQSQTSEKKKRKKELETIFERREREDKERKERGKWDIKERELSEDREKIALKEKEFERKMKEIREKDKKERREMKEREALELKEKQVKFEFY